MQGRRNIKHLIIFGTGGRVRVNTQVSIQSTFEAKNEIEAVNVVTIYLKR